MILRSMSKLAVAKEIECDIFGRIIVFSRLPMVQIMHFDLLL